MKYVRLKYLRDEHNLSQTQLAAQLGVCQRSYSAYERGERTIPPELFVKLAKIYNVSIDYMLGLTNQRYAYPRPEFDYLEDVI